MTLKRVTDADVALHFVQPQPVRQLSLERVDRLSPELVRRYQEGTLAPTSWVAEHPVLTVAGVGAAGIAV